MAGISPQSILRRTISPKLCYRQVAYVGKLAAVCLALVSLAALAGGQRNPVQALPRGQSSPFPSDPQVAASIIYDPQTNTIEVKGPGSVVSLSDIAVALQDDRLLERAGQSEWLLKVNLKVFEQVRLVFHGRAAGGDVDWLKLKSSPSGYVSVESSNGQISISNTRITSWDPEKGSFDTAFADGSGRAYISAKNRRSIYTDNRMDVIDSEIAYLGFFEETAYGISWKVVSESDGTDTGIPGKGMTGTITGSKFHHNYFGVYVYAVGDMVVRNNEIYENYSYGFDAHTYTQRTLVEDNVSRDNGLHGIIFAELCTENVVRRNTVTDNKGHGIMLHESSDNNVIEDNIVTGNDDGVPLFESSNNVIARNIITDNATGVRVYGRARNSSKNIFEGNEISGSQGYGVFIYDYASENTFRSNSIVSSRDAGIYVKNSAGNSFTDNVMRGNEYGFLFDSGDARSLSAGNIVRNNRVEDSRQFGVYSYAPAGANTIESNQFSGNVLGDVRYSGGSATRDTGGGAFLQLRLALLVAVVLAGVVAGLLVYIRKRRERWRR